MCLVSCPQAKFSFPMILSRFTYKKVMIFFFLNINHIQGAKFKFFKRLTIERFCADGLRANGLMGD